MIVLEGRERDGFDPRAETFGPILESLSLRDVSLERNPVTGELGWRAPENFAFRITGQFAIQADQSRNDTAIVRPEESLDLMIAENREAYERYLGQTKGNKKRALRLLIEDLEYFPGERSTPPTFFEGKWLVVRPNIDGSPAEIYSEDFSYKEPELIIKEELDIKTSPRVIVFHGKENGRDKDYSFIDEIDPEIIWTQWYAEVNPGVCQITMVEREEGQQTLFVPRRRPENEIELPIPEFTTERYERAYGENYVPMTDKQRHALIEEGRAIGMPFADDPLKDFVFVKLPKLRLPKSARPRRGLPLIFAARKISDYELFKKYDREEDEDIPF